MELWNFRGKQNTITEAMQLRLAEHAVVSVVGAGGKTSLIFAWARELASAGKNVVITTTTHMYRPERMEEDGIHILKLNIGNPAPFGFHDQIGRASCRERV